jgi:hypothetical protein
MSNTVTDQRFPTQRAEVSRRVARPVLWWAGAGGAFLALQIYIYAAWISSADFAPTPLGPDPVPTWEKVWAWILQPLFALGAVAVAVWVVRGCLRARRITFDAKLLLAWYSVIWLDPVGNFVRTQFLFNAYYVNRGSWVEHIPGWISPNAHLFPDALLVEFPVYGMLVLHAVGAGALMRWISRHWPRIGRVGLIGWTWLATALFMVVFEAAFCMRTGWASWSATSLPNWLVVWPGTRWQVPLIPDPIFWGAVWTAFASLRHFRDDRGRTVLDRGLDGLHVGAHPAAVISTFAVIGFANVAMALHTVPSVSASLYLRDTVPNLPSYLRDGMCGAGTAYRCPGPAVPIRLPGNPPHATIEH